MITCPECTLSAFYGALFCAGCGAPLHPAAEAHLAARQAELDRPAPPPRSLGVKAVASPDPLLEKPTAVRGGTRAATRRFTLEQLAPGGRPGLVDVTIGETTLRLPLAPDGVLHFGRSDPGGAFAPELDLDPHDGFEQGVSRRHATLRSCRQGVVLVDENSSNGTWLDGRRLAPGFAYLLPPAADVKLGELVVRLTLED
jgi:hypothetical protein